MGHHSCDSPTGHTVGTGGLDCSLEVLWVGGQIDAGGSLWSGTRFLLVEAICSFSAWGIIGISTFGVVLNSGALKLFHELQAEYNMHRTQFFCYLQLPHALMPVCYLHLPHALMPVIEAEEDILEFSSLVAKLSLSNIKQQKLSEIYKMLIQNLPDPIGEVWRTWKGELGQLDDNDWREVLEACIA
ncbi:hypothetical protein NDU88_006393 [Pleurodeles waltl]|uniref:Uncharacterized protein n=1 Tax=Pleurodeles waltl TaxID=8319 RepID=A0AAV7NXZ1_PLEWA|nr:hypothetical protein NDU88_006393 [Pleurodeles waltl]